MWSPLRLRVLPLLFLPFADASSPLPRDEHGDYNGADIIEWIRSHPDGDVHTSLRIGRERPGDPTSINGLFVSSDAPAIKKGEVIAKIPWDLLIHPNNKYGREKFFSCRAIYNLARELRLGEQSTRAPYVRYLQSMPRGTLPGEWSDAAQKFLAQMLGNGELPPYEEQWRTRFESEWVEGCSGDGDDPHEVAAYWLAASRDEDTLMVPIYDMANHSNDPEKLNTNSDKPDRPGEPFVYAASRAIRPGEQVYNSYNRCNQCSGVDRRHNDCDIVSFWTTPDIFARFGFVEDYPQSWKLDPGDDDDSSDDSETEFEVCLERDEEDGGVVALWDDDDDDMPDGEDRAWLKWNFRRLRKLGEDKERLGKELVREEGAEAENGKMSRYEWDSIWTYYEALTQAINTTIQSSSKESRWDEL